VDQQPVPTGLRAEVEHVVGAADTALALGSGDVPVLGTPRVVALAEAACVAAIRDRLPDGRTSVGTRVELAHTDATVVGQTVTAHAELTQVDGRLLRFDVALTDASGRAVATGSVTRVVVDRVRFVQRAGGSAGV
jgi:predicted thioesterase